MRRAVQNSPGPAATITSTPRASVFGGGVRRFTRFCRPNHQQGPTRSNMADKRRASIAAACHNDPLAQGAT